MSFLKLNLLTFNIEFVVEYKVGLILKKSNVEIA